MNQLPNPTTMFAIEKNPKNFADLVDSSFCISYNIE